MKLHICEIWFSVSVSASFLLFFFFLQYFMFQTPTLHQPTPMHLLHFPFERCCPFTDTVRPILGRLHSLPEWYVAISAVKTLDSVGMLTVSLHFVLDALKSNQDDFSHPNSYHENKSENHLMSLIVINKTKQKPIWFEETDSYTSEHLAPSLLHPSCWALFAVLKINYSSKISFFVNWNYCLCSFGWVPSVYSDKYFLAYYILMYYSILSYCRFFWSHLPNPLWQTQMHPNFTLPLLNSSIHPSIQCQLLLKSKEQWPWEGHWARAPVSQSVYLLLHHNHGSIQPQETDHTLKKETVVSPTSQVVFCAVTQLIQQPG